MGAAVRSIVSYELACTREAPIECRMKYYIPLSTDRKFMQMFSLGKAWIYTSFLILDSGVPVALEHTRPALKYVMHMLCAD